jgi:hypothetical protein
MGIKWIVLEDPEYFNQYKLLQIITFDLFSLYLFQYYREYLDYIKIQNSNNYIFQLQNLFFMPKYLLENIYIRNIINFEKIGYLPNDWKGGFRTKNEYILINNCI